MCQRRSDGADEVAKARLLACAKAFEAAQARVGDVPLEERARRAQGVKRVQRAIAALHGNPTGRHAEAPGLRPGVDTRDFSRRAPPNWEAQVPLGKPMPRPPPAKAA